MGRLKLPLERGGPKRVEIRWGIGQRDGSVRFDGRELGVLRTADDFHRGKDFELPDGLGRLSVRRRFWFIGLAELLVTRNGAALPGSSTDPVRAVRVAAGVVGAISALWLVVFVVVDDARPLLVSRLQLVALGEALMFAGLASLAWRWRSPAALVGAAGLWTVNGVLFCGVYLIGGNAPPWPVVLVAGGALVAIARAIRPARELARRRDRTDAF